MIAYRQGKTRKGSYAAYMDISHPDIVEFLNIRIPTGDVQRKALNLHNALNITDEFMEAVMSNSDFDLRDPKDGSVKDSINARKLWERIIETRFRTGEPYLNFIDTANRALPQNLKDLGLRINGSNLCNEIHLPTSADRTAVCCLSSLNLEYYDEWKDTNIVRDLVRMLDNVLEYFIENAPDTITRAKYSAERERSIGLGAMGFHPSSRSTGSHGKATKQKKLITLCLPTSMVKQSQKPNDSQKSEENILMVSVPDGETHTSLQLRLTQVQESSCLHLLQSNP